MIAEDVFLLLKNKEITFKNLLSISIGQVIAKSLLLENLLGDYSSYNLDLQNGIFTIDNDRKLNVQMIGSLSNTDNYWYSSECEKNIPDNQVSLEISTRKTFENLKLFDYTSTKYEMQNKTHGECLSILHSAFCPIENTLYVLNTEQYKLFLYVKDDFSHHIQKRSKNIDVNAFFDLINHIRNNYNVNDKLMIQGFCQSLSIPYEYNKIGNLLAVNYKENIIVFKFDKDILIEHSLNNNVFKYPSIIREKGREKEYLILDIKELLEILKGIVISEEIFYKNSYILHAKSGITKIYEFINKDLNNINILNELINLCPESSDLYNMFEKGQYPIQTGSIEWKECIKLIKEKAIALKNLLNK